MHLKDVPYILLLPFFGVCAAYEGKEAGTMTDIVFAPHATENDHSNIDSDGNQVRRYLGTLGPYNTRTAAAGKALPVGCKVDRVVMLARHGERYPDHPLAMWRAVRKIQAAWIDPESALGFLKDYEFFMSKSKSGHLTTDGPYAGYVTQVRLGMLARKWYSHLLPQGDDKPLNIFHSNMYRNAISAKYFAMGVTNSQTAWMNATRLVTVDEDPFQGANSLAPTFSCINVGFSKLEELVNEVMNPRTHSMTGIAKRLSQYTGVWLTHWDALYLMHMCPFEINARGTSKFCSIFTTKEWKLYSQYENESTYRVTGPGSRLSRSIGTVFLDAVAGIFEARPLRTAKERRQLQTFIPCIAHDVDIHAVVSALGIFDTHYRNNGTRIPWRHRMRWDGIDITPMGARVFFERLKCNDGHFIRIILNDSPVVLPHCHEGPANSCPLEDFYDFIEPLVDDYPITCDMIPLRPKHMTFFWDY